VGDPRSTGVYRCFTKGARPHIDVEEHSAVQYSSADSTAPKASSYREAGCASSGTVTDADLNAASYVPITPCTVKLWDRVTPDTSPTNARKERKLPLYKSQDLKMSDR